MKTLMKTLIKALVEVEMQMIDLIKTNNPSMAYTSRTAGTQLANNWRIKNKTMKITMRSGSHSMHGVLSPEPEPNSAFPQRVERWLKVYV